MAIGGGDCNSMNVGNMTASANAATCRGHLIRMFAPDNFPIQDAVVTHHAKTAAVIAVDLALRAEAEAAAASQSRVCDSESAETAGLPSDSCSACAPLPLVDAADSSSLSSAALAAAAAATASSTFDSFSRNNYRFALDLAPSLLLSLGPVVASIIKSGIGKKYLEFKALRATYVQCGGTLLLLPASKGEIFSSPNLSLMDKRCLMKFFKAIGPVSDAGADAGAEKRLPRSRDTLDGVSLSEMMTRHGLDERLQAFVAYGIAGVARLSETSASDGIESIGAYLQSVGRYSDTSAFLYCCYGSGEMAQAYCRMAAVYGGIYVLRRSVASIHAEDVPQERHANNSSLFEKGEALNDCELLETSFKQTMRRVKGVLLTDGQYVAAEHVISSSECWPASEDSAADSAADSNIDVNLRAIVISCSPISLPPDSSANAGIDPGAPVLICIPPQSPPSMSILTSSVRLLQLGSSCQVLLHFLLAF
jgi:hypothetical protein